MDTIRVVIGAIFLIVVISISSLHAGRYEDILNGRDDWGFLIVCIISWLIVALVVHLSKLQKVSGHKIISKSTLYLSISSGVYDFIHNLYDGLGTDGIASGLTAGVVTYIILGIIRISLQFVSDKYLSGKRLF